MSKPRHKSSSQPGTDKFVSRDMPRRAKSPRTQSRATKNPKSEHFADGRAHREGRTLDLTQKIAQSRKASRKMPLKPRNKKSPKAAPPRTLADKLKFFGLCSAFGVVSLSLLTFTALSYKDYGLFQSQVVAKEARLQALQTQLDTGEKRLQALQHPKGREQLLRERGYVRPGERFLQFRETEEEKRQAIFTTNDLTPHLPETLVENGDNGTSAWRRVANAFSGWWNSLRRASDTPTPLPIPPAEENATQVKTSAKQKSQSNDNSSSDASTQEPVSSSGESSDFSVEN